MKTKILSKSAMLLFVLVLVYFSYAECASAEGSGVSKDERSEGSGGWVESETTNEEAGCGPSILNATVGGFRSLHSPNYPQNYPSIIECWWTITAPLGYYVLINFTTFELKGFFGYLEVYHATSKSNATQPYTRTTSAYDSSPFFVPGSNCFTIRFSSEWITQRKEFELIYRATTVDIACSTLPTSSNGGQLCYFGKGNTFYCRFFCNKSFKLSGSERRWCKSNGYWTGNEVTCVEIKSCGELPVPEHGSKRCTDGHSFDSTCNITCNDGYELFGSESRTCKTFDIKWSGIDASCQNSPPKPTCDVDRSRMCDGRYYCDDKSDEIGCTCPHYKFKCDCYETGCRSPFGCIPQSWRCNGYDECSDKSDERDCQCSDTRFQCKDGECIDRSKVNDGSTDCVLRDDEFICNKSLGHVSCDCKDNNDRCSSSGRCIPNSWIGDTIPDCENNTDEPCNASKIWCDECWVRIYQCMINKNKNILLRHLLENETRCHTLTVSSDRTQLVKTNWICINSPCGKCRDIFQCESGQYIDNEHYCDSTPHCDDVSDETKNGFGFRCSGKSRKPPCILPQKNLYDNNAQCANDSDLCFMNGEFRCFSCLDGKLIVSAKQVCNGIVDCYDMSDECLCANQSVCNAVLGEESTRCPFNQMHCNTENDCVDMNKVLCNSSVSCKSGKNRMFCHDHQKFNRKIHCQIVTEDFSLKVITATMCDGRPECAELEDECDCIPQPSFCNDRCGQLAQTYSNGNHVCDGYVNQIMRENRSCDQEVERSCPMRFYCKSKNKISIDKRSVCDGIVDCDDHSDENSTDCGNKRFLCTKGNAVSIDKAFVCDGIKDCDNGEDEVLQLCGEYGSLFSDQYEMLANPILRSLFWIMGLLALIGNSVICVNTAKAALFCENNNIVKTANNIFILNLTASDFLMGVYLIAVVVKGTIYSGYYGSVDKEWRSSKRCSGLGTLAVLSSETSAFLMATMSTFRLITVYKPFFHTSIKIRWIFIAVCSCWIVSFLLAAIPWFPFDSGYFISHIWFPNLIFKTSSVSKPDLLLLAKRVSGENPEQRSWFEIKEIVSDAFEYNPIKGEFGYYGGTSVCMPRLYATTNEAAWQYSAFLITLNLLLFIYMMITYILVYKKANGTNQSRTAKKDPNKKMQKRISRLLLTDFCCWIPVCIMGYLSLAGVYLPPTAYLASAGFLLPINSALNPILYSKFIEYQASQAKNWMIENVTTICPFRVDKNDVVESGNVKTEDVGLRVINST